MSCGHLQEVKKGGKSLNHKRQIMLAVPYGRWSLTRGSNWKALTGKVLVFRIGGHIWRFDYIIILGLKPRDKGVNTNTVKPVLSGHPQGMLWCPLNTGCPPNTGFDR